MPSVSLCSSLDNGANNCKTETTQIEADSSLFLEITPPDVEEDGTKLKVAFFSHQVTYPATKFKYCI